MIIKKTKTVKVEKTTHVVCDKCGKQYGLDYRNHDSGNEIWEAQEFHHINFVGGFASVFGDGTKVECDLCQHCLLEMIGNFCRKDTSLNVYYDED
ncbi:MAG TPA: hypothetical protein DC057_11930 [Spirochaetia bacterium]|nr:hypothetical protein [Spirochaetia bacterium]